MTDSDPMKLSPNDQPGYCAGHPNRKLSITPEMLLMIWSHEWSHEQNGNYVSLIHPKGWIFSLGKFRVVPTTLPTIEETRVRMFISVESGTMKGRVVSSFIHTVFNIDLDDCYLCQLFPLLYWIEDHDAEKWVVGVTEMANRVSEF